MNEWLNVAPVDDFPPHTRRLVALPERDVVVFNLDGRYFALEDRCSHDGSPISAGKVQGRELTCPRHGARFSVESGAALTLPALEGILKVPVRIFEGMVQVQCV
ncbi:MAG: Rieske 2Fe-2S domain-containing protein [Magnetococcales bacterium]|nr:Rieske 2Fe-2S domain-containing protein [Magnetococcales bacterium]